jgi:hypothetical protein
MITSTLRPASRDYGGRVVSYRASIDGVAEDVEHFFAGVLPVRPAIRIVNNSRWHFGSGVLWIGLRDERVSLQVPV